ncbi:MULTISPECIES: hypothetical protein [unclassified Gemella]|uniref:hypothetical protein n=1 Tax=unclassified Gemella TaxID=2624949 RepID=UPI001C045D70|nr:MULTISPECIES: hypothetical protein [unclassified Gemella]MBU0278776.1 hypothetical protein [Gemella sp. zg-1178]QWQ38715.1 hypothetical protein KMP11_07165 [Gemella sp. zg-570]
MMNIIIILLVIIILLLLFIIFSNFKKNNIEIFGDDMLANIIIISGIILGMVTTIYHIMKY